MREILFRGKRKDNGKWVEGYYARKGVDRDTFKHFICVMTFNVNGNTYSSMFYLTDIEVIPETVGQYTGLTDKNGRKVFEGDVVKLFDIAIGEIVCEYGAFGINCRQQIDYDYLASEIASVTGCDNTPMFCRNDNFVSLWELYWNYNQESSEISVIEVIGNIHGNPELLKNN